MTTRTARRTVLAVTLAGLVGTLAACGGTAPAAPAATSRDTAAAAKQDAAFATAMFDHRHRALQLVGLVAQYGQSSDVVAFAGDLQTGYDTQMRDLQEMLTGWGKPVPHVEGHSDLGDDIPGLLTAAQLAALRAATPTEFEKHFLTILAAREKRAAALAREELQRGADPQATAYAKDVAEQTGARLARITELLQKGSRLRPGGG